MTRTAAQLEQLANARKNTNHPQALASKSEKMKRYFRENEEKRLQHIAFLHSPEARRKAAEAARRPVADRFHKKVSIEPNSGCWLWTGAHHRLGYGQLRVDGKNVLATHISLALAGRERPFPGACARHKCDNPPCVNPDHLEWGTHKENMADALERGRLDMSGLELGRKRRAA